VTAASNNRELYFIYFYNQKIHVV